MEAAPILDENKIWVGEQEKVDRLVDWMAIPKNPDIVRQFLKGINKITGPARKADSSPRSFKSRGSSFSRKSKR